MFVYRIDFILTNEFYFGSKTSKYSCFSQLGKTYFSSSKRVQLKLFEDGITNVIFSLISTHNSKQECMQHETSLILEHINNDQCLNLQWSNRFKQKIKLLHQQGHYKNRNINLSAIMKEKWSNTEFRTLRIASLRKRQWSLTDEKKQKAQERMLLLHQTKKCTYDNVSGTIWINDGNISKRIKNTLAIPDGFIKGRL